MFIVFEGIDRSGKSTQASWLRDYLLLIKKKVKVVSYPDRTNELGLLLRRHLSGEIELEEHAAQLLFSAERWQRNQEIKNLLATGTIVIADRYFYSGQAYAVTAGLPREWAVQADVGLVEPDHVIYLDLDPVVGLLRETIDERHGNIDFQKRLRVIYRSLYVKDGIGLEKKKVQTSVWHTVIGKTNPVRVFKDIMRYLKF